MTTLKVALVTGAGSGIGRRAYRWPWPKRAMPWCSPAVARTPSTRSKARSRAKRHRRVDRYRRSRFRRSPLCRNKETLSAASMCCSTMPAWARPPMPLEDLTHRAVEGGGRHQSVRRLLLHAGGLPADEGAEASRRPHHQQWLDLGPRAAPVLGALHGDQARHHRSDPLDLA